MLADIEAGRDEARYSKRARAEREHYRKLCRETLAAASIPVKDSILASIRDSETTAVPRFVRSLVPTSEPGRASMPRTELISLSRFLAVPT